MTDADRQTAPRGLPYLLLASAVLLLAYLLTAGRVFSWEALAFGGRLDGNPWLADRWPATQFFNPDHLLLFVFGYPFKALLQGFGIAGDSMAALQILNAVLGAASALLVGWILARATGSPRRGIVGALGFGVCQATWHFSTTVAAVVPAGFFLLLGLLLLSGNGGWRRFVGAGVCLAAAILIHQPVALLALAVTVFFVVKLQREKPGAGYAWRGGLILAIVYIGFVETESGGGFLKWVRGEGERGLFQPTFISSLISIRRPLANSFVSLGFPVEMEKLVTGLGDYAFGLVIILMITLLLALVLGFLLILRTFRQCSPIFPGIILGILVLVVSNAASNPWYEARWYYVVPLAWLVIGFRIPRKIPPPPGALKTIIALWLVLLAGTTFFGSVLPVRSAERAHYGSLIGFVNDNFEEGDVLINGPIGPVVPGEFIHLAYFCNVDAIRFPPPEEEDRQKLFRRRLLAVLERSSEESPTIHASEEVLSNLTDLGVSMEEARPMATLRGSRIHELPPQTANALRRILED
jgi:hypothetical protein